MHVLIRHKINKSAANYPVCTPLISQSGHRTISISPAMSVTIRYIQRWGQRWGWSSTVKRWRLYSREQVCCSRRTTQCIYMASASTTLAMVSETTTRQLPYKPTISKTPRRLIPSEFLKMDGLPLDSLLIILVNSLSLSLSIRNDSLHAIKYICYVKMCYKKWVNYVMCFLVKLINIKASICTELCMFIRSVVYALPFGKAFELGNGRCANCEEWTNQWNKHDRAS